MGKKDRTGALLRSNVLPNAQRARETLQKLECVLDKRLSKADGSINKIAWLRVEDQVRTLQKDLRNHKVAMVTALSVLNIAIVSRLETRIQAVQLVMESGQSSATAKAGEQSEALQQALLTLMEGQKQNEARLVSLEDLILTRVPSSDSERSNSTSSDASDRSLSIPSYDHRTVPVDEHQPRIHSSHFSALRLKFLHRRRCNPYCACGCHQTTRLNSPRILQSLVGVLFVGYSSIPKFTPPCTTPKCQGSPEGLVSMTYHFPRWLASRAVAAAIRLGSNQKPQISITPLHIRDCNDSIFLAAAEGDAVTVRRLLNSHQASVRDIASSTGHTALHLAVMRSHVEVITALLQSGAEPLLENATHETPYDMAWSTVLCFEDTPNSEIFRVSEIKDLFPSTAALEERRMFSRVHQIVLKLIHIDLEIELRSGRTDVDTPDVDGRTALHWAAGRGDEKTVSLLLKYGADPNRADRIGQGPLRSSMKASDPQCMKLLVRHRANVMQTDHWGQTCLQAAMYYSDPVGFGTPLIEAGIDINAQDNTKSYPLLEAVRAGLHDAIIMLLDKGADLNIRDTLGLTPFLVAVSRNDHVAVKLLLLTRAVDATVRDVQQRNVLHYAAEYADVAMLRLLIAAGLEDLDIKSVREDGLSAIEIAEKRCINNLGMVGESEKSNVGEDWIKTFALLLDSILQIAGVDILPFKDEEDRSTEYFTGSPTDSIYVDAQDLSLSSQTAFPTRATANMPPGN